MRPSLRPPWPTQTTLLRWHPRAPQRIPRRIATTSAANAAPVDIPKLVLSPGSKHHDSLPSFLEYAKRTNLAADKTVYIGTHYEYTAALSLMRLGFSLLRIGRKNDAGIDLIGHWVLPPLREPMPTIIQCKARTSSVHPSHIRELEGSFQGIPAGWRNKHVLGLIVTTRKATKGTMEALGQSQFPLGFLMVAKDGTIQQFVWNRVASEQGLEGVGVTVRHTPPTLLPEPAPTPDTAAKPAPIKRAPKIKSSGMKKDIQLTWMGTPIFADRSKLSPDTLDLIGTIEPDVPDHRKSKKPGRGRPCTAHKAPSPRGGLLPARKRTKGSLKKLEVVEAKKRGRPKGSKNKPKVVDET